MKQGWRGAVVFGLGLFFLAPAPMVLADDGPFEVISVSGRGVVSVKPDMAEIRTGVVSQDRTAEAALKVNSAAVSRVIDGLTELGITSPDVQTQSFSVSPLYGRRDSGSGEPVPVVGFQVSNQVLVRVRDVTRAGTILDALVKLGANQVGHVAFRVDDSSAAMDEARVAAVGDARRKAEMLAEAAGVSLGRVLSIQEGGGATPFRPVGRADMAFAEAVPIEPGEQAIAASVSVVFALDE